MAVPEESMKIDGMEVIFDPDIKVGEVLFWFPDPHENPTRVRVHSSWDQKTASELYELIRSHLSIARARALQP